MPKMRTRLESKLPPKAIKKVESISFIVNIYSQLVRQGFASQSDTFCVEVSGSKVAYQ